MWENRERIITRKPRIILDKRFPVTNQLELGDSGTMIITGVIDAEGLEFQEDNVERIVKTVLPKSIELLENKTARI